MRLERRLSARGRKTAQETRTDILRQAEMMFVAEGYELATIAGIAAAIGVSPATVFKYFRSKAQLAAKVLERRLLVECAGASEIPNDELMTRVRVIADNVLDACRVRPHLFSLMRVVLGDDNTEVLFRQYYQRCIYNALADHLTADETRELTPALADMFVAMLHSSAIEGQETQLRRRLEHFVCITIFAASGISFRGGSAATRRQADTGGSLAEKRSPRSAPHCRSP